MKPTLKFLNDNHWYIIAGIVLAGATSLTYGMQSKCPSLLNPQNKVNREELQNEVNYIIGRARAMEKNLDRQDAVKQALLDAANVMGTGGQINPSGLINLAASIGGISFGLTQRQKLKAATVKKPTETA